MIILKKKTKKKHYFKIFLNKKTSEDALSEPLLIISPNSTEKF
jgi:hypothetical protein